jgi:uncharacterized protein
MKRSLTFDEALKTSAPAAFSSMVKPAGSACNLDCHYCYYLDKPRFYDGRQPVMDDGLLELYIKQYIEANEVPKVTFVWHGGEPLMLPPAFYRKAIALQQKYADGREIENTLQTNGLLLDGEWCRLFAENGFLVGVSIDGPADLHDAFRRNKAGAPTFERVMRGIEQLRRYGVEFNTLSVVNRRSEGRGREVYRFLKSIGSRFMQFLPAVEFVRDTPGGERPVIVPPGTLGSRPAEWSVTAAGYGRFLNEVFDDWVTGDVGNRFVQIFDAALAQWYGVPPGVCTLSESCGEALVVEHNGDVYPCDHFVYPEYRLGNIRERHLREMYRSPEQFAFGLNKRNTLPEECLRCKYYFACKGECPKHRFDTAASGEQNKNTLCEGFQLFFKHIDPYMRAMCELLDAGQSPALVIPWARQRMGITG